MSNKIIRYVPKFINDNDTMNSLYLTQKEEIEKINSSIMEVFDNNFVQSSNLKGVQKYENILNIKSYVAFDIEFRKRKILDKFMYKPPFTRQRFQSILENIWGKGNFLFEIYPNSYEVIIDIDTDEPNYYLIYFDIIRDTIPSNMYLILSIQYTYLYLNRSYTYDEMGNEFTYGELSKYSEEALNEIYG